MTRRLLLQRLVRGGIGLGVASLGGLAYAHDIEPARLRISRHDIVIAGLPRALDGLSIAHLTDIHMDAWMTRERIAGVSRAANALRADMILITGDFLSRGLWARDDLGRPLPGSDIAPGLSESLSILHAPLGVWGVLGNHDHWAADEAVSHHFRSASDAAPRTPSQPWVSGAPMKRALREGGVRELDNKIAPIERNGARLWLCGVDDLWAGQPDFESVLKQLEQQSAPDEVAILMAHEPDFADTVAQSGRISLQLSGHSHGGQVRLPFCEPPILPMMGRKYHTGLYQIPTAARALGGSMQVFTSRGIGVVRPRLRFNCPPEIALLTLRSA